MVIFCLLLPVFIGLKLLIKFNKLEKLEEKIINYVLLLFISNLICFMFVAIINNFDGNLLIYMNDHLKFCVKYMLLMIFVNIFLAFVFSIFTKYTDIQIEVKHEKNIKNN